MTEASKKVDKPIEIPLTSAYPFGSPGEPIILHEGLLTGVTAEGRPGSIYLSLDPVPSLRWKIDPDGEDFWTETGDIRLSFERPSVSVSARGVGNTYGDGSLNGVEAHSPNGRIKRALFHWVNLPPIQGNTLLATPEGSAKDSTQTLNPGRIRLQVGEWDLVLDRRPDHTEAVKEARAKQLYLVTHLMEIRRTDGSEFHPDEIRPLCEALRLGFSLAFGRWVSPAIETGYNNSGETVWERWGAPICDAYKPIGSPLIYWGSLDDLTDFIERTVERFQDPSKYDTTAFQMFLAAQTAELGFVENRIFSTFPALENLCWVRLKLDAERTNSAYDSLGDSAARIEIMLKDASVPVAVDPDHLPELHRLAKEKGLNGPGAVVWVRNRLVHPKNPHDTIYGSHNNLVVEAWLLARQYVCLLILHSINYRGRYLPAVPPSGSLYGAVPVPWS